MSRVEVVLRTPADRKKVCTWAMNVDAGTRITFKEAKRSTDQNSLMWTLLSRIAREVPYHGLRLSPDDYKLLFLDALKREVRMVPNLDSTGFTSLGRSSSDLSKAEFSDLIELIYKFGAEHGVAFGDEVAA